MYVARSQLLITVMVMRIGVGPLGLLLPSGGAARLDPQNTEGVYRTSEVGSQSSTGWVSALVLRLRRSVGRLLGLCLFVGPSEGTSLSCRLLER